MHRVLSTERVVSWGIGGLSYVLYLDRPRKTKVRERVRRLPLRVRSAMNRIEYRALRRICGAYHGSRHTSLAKIAAVETLDSKLNDISASWAGRAVRNGDWHIRQCLGEQTASEAWHEEHRMYAYDPRHDGLHSAIQRAFRITDAEPEELSYGDRDDTGTTHLTDMQLIEPEDPRSEYEAFWLTMISEKLDEGWRTAYSDGCSRQPQLIHMPPGRQERRRRKDDRGIPQPHLHGSGQREGSPRGPANGLGHATDPHGQHGSKGDGNQPGKSLRGSPKISDRERDQAGTTTTRSPSAGHRHQLGQSTHRDSRQRASRPTRHLPTLQGGNIHSRQDRHRRGYPPHSQGSEGKREDSSRLWPGKQDPVGMAGPRSLYLVQDGEGTTPTMAPQDRKSGGPILSMRGSSSVRGAHRLAVQASPGRAKTELSRTGKGMGGPRRLHLGPRRRRRR